MVEADSLKVDWPWEMEIVSGKFCKFDFFVNGVYLMCVVLVCSNYDKWYYRKRFHMPTDSSPDPEDHPYSLGDPQALPK